MSLISNVPCGQYRKYTVKTQTFLTYINDYRGIFSRLDGLQDFKYIINTFGYLVVHLAVCSISENGQCLMHQGKI